MTDLLARLRAVNPVPTCEPPTVQDVWRRLEFENQIPPGARRPERRGLDRRRGRSYGLSWVRLRLRHVGLGLAIVVPVLFAGLAIVLLGHNRSASPRRPSHSAPAIAPSHRGASSSIDAALARGIRPPEPSANLALPILGSSATRSLTSFRGKVVVLSVFASWCQPCKAQTAALEQAQAVITGQGATVLGVTYEDRSAAAEAFVRATHITYPVLRDASDRPSGFVRSFGITGVPETFIIDRRGRIAAAHASPIDDRWLTQTLGRLFPSQHLIPAGFALKSPPTTAELAVIANAYPVLDRRQQPTDIPPRGALDPYAMSQGGLVANSRRALVTPRGESLYIVPAHQSICVASSDNVVQGCQPFPFTATTPADISATICAPNLPSTELEVAGLLPPNASDIKAHYSNGSSQAVTATNGMIAIYAPFKDPLPRSITWMSPKGPEHTGTAVPPDAASSKCAS
jgi:cytochrome c biogenesis protein CcmG/thiol:disulfide interchange protein DsbE